MYLISHFKFDTWIRAYVPLMNSPAVLGTKMLSDGRHEASRCYAHLLDVGEAGRCP